MINLEIFISLCEHDLLQRRNLSESTLVLINNLSDRSKILCKPIIDFIVRMEYLSVNNIDEKVFSFSSKERILVCSLIPLTMKLDTKNPAWSSFLLAQAIRSSSNIQGVKLTEIGLAFLSVFCRFSTPLNKIVYNFCIDFVREFTIQHKKRLSEFESLAFWNNSHKKLVASAAFLRDILIPSSIYNPQIMSETAVSLVDNIFLEDFINENRYLLENSSFRKNFLIHLRNFNLIKDKEKLIISIVEGK